MNAAARMRAKTEQMKEGLHNTTFEREESQGGRSTGGRTLRGDPAEQSAWNFCLLCLRIRLDRR